MDNMIDFNKIGIIDKKLVEQLDSALVPELLEQRSIYHYTSISG